jgi:hypothetical protein
MQISEQATMKLTKEQDALFDLYGGEVSPGEAMPDSMKAAVVRKRKARSSERN